MEEKYCPIYETDLPESLRQTFEFYTTLRGFADESGKPAKDKESISTKDFSNLTHKAKNCALEQLQRWATTTHYISADKGLIANVNVLYVTQEIGYMKSHSKEGDFFPVVKMGVEAILYTKIKK